MAESGLLDRLTPGDHVCLVYNDDPLRIRSVAGYIRAGLRDHHRILYDGPGGEQVTTELTAQGVDVRHALDRGQLRFGGQYPRGGIFDPDATFESWQAEVRRTAAAGYRGMRAVGDMSWARDEGDQLFRYEARVNRIFAEGFAMGVCLYDRRLFSEGRLRRVTGTHPTTVTAESDARLVPLLRAVRTADPPGIRLEGEADLSNREAFREVLEHLAEAPGSTLTVDVSRLRFADSASVRILLMLLGGRRRVVLKGCSGWLRRLLAFHGVDHLP
jgi:anti-anti-sigma factor